MFFENAIAVSNWTLPTHASILTGLYPRSHGARAAPVEVEGAKQRFEKPVTALKPGVPTLAQVLAANGYETAAIFSNFWWLQPVFGISRGFDKFFSKGPSTFPPRPDSPRGIYDEKLMEWRAKRRSEGKATDRASAETALGPQPKRFPYLRGTVITDLALEWLREERDTERPFFLALNYLDPHAPYAPPPPFDRQFLPEHLKEGFTSLITQVGVLNTESAASPYFFPTNPLIRTFIQARYWGEMAYLDSEIGRLLAALREDGRLDQTIVVLVSDHGEMLFEHEKLGHSQTLYREEVRIPLMIRLPRGIAAKRRPEFVSQADIMPTILDLLGIDGNVEFEGRSLGELATTSVFAEFFGWGGPDAWRRGLFDEDWVYLDSGVGQQELFDLKMDPKQALDLSEVQPARRDEMAADLEEWTRTAPDFGEVVPADLSPEDVERLRALGYLQ